MSATPTDGPRHGFPRCRMSRTQSSFWTLPSDRSTGAGCPAFCATPCREARHPRIGPLDPWRADWCSPAGKGRWSTKGASPSSSFRIAFPAPQKTSAHSAPARSRAPLTPVAPCLESTQGVPGAELGACLSHVRRAAAGLGAAPVPARRV